jgi:putative addiction module component (TIGR02574 family)
MSKNFENVLEQVHQLTRSEQLALISSLAQMLGEDEMDYGVNQEDAAELERRFAETENGTAVLLDGETVEKELAAEYGITL